jgi:hypothetical protein
LNFSFLRNGKNGYVLHFHPATGRPEHQGVSGSDLGPHSGVGPTDPEGMPKIFTFTIPQVPHTSFLIKRYKPHLKIYTSESLDIYIYL